MRKRIRGRVLAGILAAVLLCTAVPETAYAVEGTEGTELPVQEQVESGDEQPETAREDDKNPGEGEVPEDDETPGNGENPEGDKTLGDGEDLGGDGTPGDGDAVEGDPIPGDENVSEGDTVPGEQETDGIVEELPASLDDEEMTNPDVLLESVALYSTVYDIDNYPDEYKNMDYWYCYNNAIADKWYFVVKQCTSFVAFRLNEVNGVSFGNRYGGVRWGDARNWKTAAISCGIKVDMTPAKGSVYWVDRGTYGHVAWVSAVNGDKVTIEDYNLGHPNNPGVYNRRTVDANTASGYIHIKDLSEIQPETPKPIPGSEMTEPCTRTIADGDYHIVTALDGDMCLAVDRDCYTENGASVGIYHSVEEDFQVWTVTWLGPNKGYKVIHKFSGKSLDVAGESTSAGEDENGKDFGYVWQWEYYNPSARTQDWVIKEVDNGAYYTVQSGGSGFYLDVKNGIAADKTNVRMLTGNESAAQKWRFIPAGTQTIPNGEYYITSDVKENMCLDILNASTADDANAVISSMTGRRSQMFSVSYLNNGFYKIINKNSGKSLNVFKGEATRGTNVIQYEHRGGTPQQWTLRDAGGGSYYIQPRCSGHYLDVANAQTAENTNVWTTVWMGGAATQKWKFVPVEKPKLAPPTASIPSGSAVETGAWIWLDGGIADSVYWTYDGTDPRVSDTRILGCKVAMFDLGRPLVIKAFAVKEGYQSSDVAEFIYTIKEYTEPGKSKLNAPTASIPTNTEVEKGTEVSLSCGVNGASIYYTLDGTDPTVGSLRYSRPVVIEKDTVIKAYAVKEGYLDSDPAVFTYLLREQDDFGRGDVLEEDIPQGKVENIPHGLWMSAVPSQVYTGKAVKPKVRVYDYKTLLTEKKDYIISYKNNTKANAASGAYPPAITVTGKGNYTGKETQTFVIRPKRLSDVDVVADDITLQYNGRTQKPVPVITWDGRKLSKNRDYTLSYPDEERDGAANPGAYTKEGAYTVLLCGVGNYAGERKIRLTITRSRPASVMKVDKVADQVFTGEEVRPVLTVRDDRSVLTEGEDYEISFQNNVKVGTAFAVIAGKGTYTGTKRVSFQIVQKASLNQAKAELAFGDSVVYTGGEVKPAGYKLTVSARKADGNKALVTLAEGTDFTVSYRNNIKPGTATIFFQGINGYTGTLKKTYKISPYKIGESVENDGEIRVELADAYAYAKGGCKPEPVVFFQGKVLKKGTDYTLSYKNNTCLYDGNSAGKQPTVRVKGKGCFTGSCELTYKITAKDMDGLTMSAADRVWQNRGKIYQTKVVIRDVDGKALSAGRDYEKLLRYEYGADVTLPGGTVRRAGEEVSGNDILPAGTLLRVTATAKGDNYTGEVSCCYRIAKADIGKAKVTIPAQTYTGREIKPDGEMQVKLNGQILSEDNYEVTGYANNINKGTATVTIRGRNDCGGVKTVKFRIKGKGFLWWWR
ncbi:MAG: RICIN domain-containing protein [Lachnospiraceae bacterium]|nr:RICIN domain-containing protein [Lachnospiraceae bacterium]